MENLHKLVYEATMKPERFRFFVATQNPDDAIRFLLLYRVNDCLTKKVMIVCNEGEYEEYGAIKIHKYACFDAMDLIEVEAKEGGYKPVSLEDFVGVLVSMSQLYNEPIDELI
jgi:hypothetical protein